MRGFFLFLSIFTFTLSYPVLAVSFDDLRTDDFTTELLKEKKEFQGEWHGGNAWKGFLCNGESHYQAGIKGKLSDIQIQVIGKQLAELQVEVVDLAGSVFGSYRSSKVLCIPFRLGLGFVADRVTVNAQATVVETPTESKFKVKVVSTNFKGFRFSKSLPTNVEEFLNRAVNAAFRWVWDSRLGNWISQRLTDYVNKYEG